MAVAPFLLLATAVLAVTAFPDDTYRDALQFKPTGQSTRGTDFMVAFLPNSPVSFSDPQYQLLISTAEPETVIFTVSLSDNLPPDERVGFPYTGNVSYGEVHTVLLPNTIGLTTDLDSPNPYEKSKTIRIRTQNGKQITVQGFNDNVRTSDGFIAISCDAMRQPGFNEYEYFIMAADQFPSPADPPKSSVFLMIPCDDDTFIRIEPTQLLTVTRLSELRPSSLRAGPGTSASYLTFTANAGLSMLLGHNDDLSGTIIRSSRPLIVFSGHECGEIPYNHTACDHMVEQIPPGMAYGQTFFLTPLGGRVSGDQFRVGTLRDSTQLTVTCVTSATDTPTRLPLERNGRIDKGEYITFLTPGNFQNRADYKPSYCCLDSTQPVIVAQYSTGYSFDRELLLKRRFSHIEAGDPFMSLVPPVHQFMNNHSVKSVDGLPGPFPYRYINLAIATDFFTNSPSDRNRIKINGTAVVPYDGYIPFYCSNGRICGYGAEVEVPKGTHTIYHEQPEVGLYASYYAYQQQNSNAFPLGFELEPLAATGAAIPENLCIREDAGTLVIPVERYGNLVIQSRFDVATRPSTPVEAVASQDYTHYQSRFNYRGGIRQDVLHFVNIQILDDTIPEVRESFEISFTPTRNLYLRNNIIKVFICDNDGDTVDPCICDEVATQVWFDPTSYTVNENAGTATLTIRTNIAGGPPAGSVHFNTTDGTAIAGSDYTFTTTEVSFQPGFFATTVEVPIIEDRVAEGEEMFQGTLTTANGANVLITESRADVTINDNDVQVWFNPSSYTVNEAAGTVTLTIRTNFAGGPPPGSVRFTTTDGTASVVSDYMATSSLVSFGADSLVTTVTVPIVDDSVGEHEEVFYGNLTAVGNFIVQIPQDRADIHINDDDVRVWFEPTSYTVDESTGTVTLIVRTNIPGGPSGVEFYTSDGTAVSPGDFNAVTSVPVVFGEGSLVTSVTVTINEDSIVENDEVFTGNLRHVGEGTVQIVEDEATVTIIDDDVAVIGFSPSVYSVNEDGIFAILTIVNRNQDLEREVIVQVSTVSGSATAGSDFNGIVQTVTFSPGTQSESVLVLITDDDEYEGTEDFYGTLTTTDGFVSFFQPNASIIIVDDDARVYFERDTYEVSETDGTVEVCVRREGDVSGSLTVQVSTADFVPRQAEAGSDYVAVQRSVTFGANEDRACFLVTILDDQLSEGVENFTARITSVPSGIDIGSPETTVISIMDDETLIIEFEVSEYTVIENEGTVAVCLKTNIGNDVPINIIVSTSHIETSDGDYNGAPQVVQIPGSSGPTRACANIVITGDTIVEDNEDFRVSFEIPSGTTAIPGVITTTRVLIIDDDIVQVGFTPSVYTVTEGDTFVLLTVVNRNPNLERDVVVNIETFGETATDGVDFRGMNQTLTFVHGDASGSTLIFIVDDELYEGTEDFYVTLTTTDSAVEIFQPIANVTIIDEDVRVYFESDNYVVSETDGRVDICVRREGDLSGSLTINVATEELSPSQAQSGIDYIDLHPELQVLSFQPNEDRICFDVVILDDVLSEGVENFTARIISVPTGVDIGNPETTFISITDDDNFVIDFEVPEYTVTEDAGSVTLCLTTSTGNTIPVTISFMSRHVTTSDGDYTSYSDEVIPVSSGPSRVCVDIPIVDDDIVEIIEDFIVTFEGPPGTTGTNTTTRVVIVDNDYAEIGFNPTVYSVVEGGGALIIIENMTPHLERNVTVQFFTVDGTAVDGTDYIGVPGSFPQVLTFSPNETLEYIIIPTLDDSIFEGIEEFNASLTTTDSAVRITQPDATVHIIENDEVRVYFENTTYVVEEDRGPAIVCIVREGEISETITIQVSTAELVPPQATAGEDFLSLSGVPIQFRPHEYRVCRPISIVRDDVSEDVEDFEVIITSLPPGVVTGTPDRTIVTIFDEPQVITAEVCGGVCDRLEKIEKMLEKICDKLDTQDVKLRDIMNAVVATAAK